MKQKKNADREFLLAYVKPSKAIVDLAVPATLALLAKAVYNIVDTAYIGMLDSDTALAAVGVTLPLLLIIAAYGVVQRLILIGCYVVMGFMQGYQPVASYAFGAKNKERFNQSAKFAVKGSLLLTVAVAGLYIVCARPLILLFNKNPLVVEYGKWLLMSQVVLYPAFGLCYMMTITYQTIGASGMGLFLSLARQCIFYIPFILTLPGKAGVRGIYFSQPAADVLTLLLCVALIKPMKRQIQRNMETGTCRQ